MTTTLGLSFSARSVAKRFILFAINITILLLGVACSVLCLYQVKLMPAYYDEILANLKESNLTDLASARIKIMPAHQAFTQRLPVAAESDSQLLTRNKQKVTTPKSRTKTSTPLKQTTKFSTTVASIKTTRSKQKPKTIPTSQQMWPLLTVSTPRSTTTTSNKQPIALMSNENQIIPVNNLGELSKFDEKLFEAALKNSLQTKTDTSSVPHLHYYEHPYMSTSQASTIRTTIEVTSKLSTTTMKPVTTTLKRDQALSTSTAYSTSKTAANASLPLITKPNLEIQISLNATAADVPKNLSTPPAFSVKTPSTSYQVGSQEISQHNISLIGPESSKLADKSVGAIDLSSAFEKIQPVLHKSSAPDHSKRRRNVAYSSQSTWDSSSQTAQTMIPSYFQEIFELVQTSLYTCTAAGVLIFFSSLIGICGGLFRVNGCLKFSVGALVIVIIGEMATIGFVFFAHDKASNRSKFRNFNEDFKVLCDLAHFCINEMMLIMVGSFLCVSVVLQIGSITLSCHLMDTVNENDTDLSGNGWRKGVLNRADLQISNGMMPFANSMAMQTPYFAGQNMSHPYSASMPMYGMGCFHQPMGPGQRPVINIIS